MPRYNSSSFCNVQCPYYLIDAKVSITCEGYGDTTEEITRFKSENEKFKYQECNCFKYPNMCFKALLLDQLYQIERKILT